MRAMILAAGRGARMRPLTDAVPKPLLKVGDKPLIAYHLIKLASLGITEVVINIAYLADVIKNTLGDGRQYGVHIEYSYEPEALETGGGIYQALPLLGDEPFLVVSGDVWTAYPFERLPKQLSTSLAHLVLVPNPEFHPRGDFTCEDGLLGLEGPHKFTFGNIGVYHPQFFADCKPGFFRLGDLMAAWINKQQVGGEVYCGEWYNIGTPAQLAFLQGKVITTAYS